MAFEPNLHAWLIAVLLTLPRIAVAFLILPFTSQQILAGPARSAATVGLIAPAVPLTYMHLPPGDIPPIVVAALLGKEALAGLFLGFVLAIPFWIVTSAGVLVDNLRGEGAGTMYSPIDDASTPTSIAFNHMAVLLLFATGGFVLMLNGLYLSYALWPVISWLPQISTAGISRAIDHFQSITLWMMVLGAPFLVTVFMVDLVMGLLNRFIPEINVFILSFPFRVLMVMFLLTVYMVVMTDFLETRFVSGDEWLHLLRELLE